MQRHNDVRVAQALMPESITFNVLCGVPSLAQMIAHQLESGGYQHDPQASIVLLVDMPNGFAMRQLEEIDRSDLTVIVATSHAHPEYWQDILSLKPAILLVGDCCNREVADAIFRAASGEQYHRTPKVESPLTPTERAILRQVARGWSNRQIAAHLSKSEQTVANTLNSVYSKLRLRGRVALALYYWGSNDLVR